jgi:hypothetical protein
MGDKAISKWLENEAYAAENAAAGSPGRRVRSMPLYEMTASTFRPVPEASFVEMGIGERSDIQRLLRTQIDVLGDDLYVLTEEFGEWEDSKRRIDLLAVDSEANLVVIELKRTADGGHMELQAIRYASMVSAMTFERAVLIHADFLHRMGQPREESQVRLLDFLGWDEPHQEKFAEDVRIVLVSENFSKELTTAVLWLRDREIDIRCVRLQPYRDGAHTLIDVQQIIPLPEAHDYQVQLREKEQQERRQRAERDDERLRFWEGVIAIARERNTRHANIKPGLANWLGASSGVRGLGFNYVVVQNYAVVEIYLDRGDAEENKAIFARLLESRAEIERAFGAELIWDRLDARRACRIKHRLHIGGYRSPEAEWPAIQAAMVDAMTWFERAILPAIEALDL